VVREVPAAGRPAGADAWPERGGARPAGFFTKRSAEAELRRILTDAEPGTLAAAYAPASGKTFADATAESLRYVERDRGRRAATLHDYMLVARQLEAEFGAATPLGKITPARVEAYRDRLLEEGRVGRRTVQKNLVLLGGVMKRATRLGWVPVTRAGTSSR
jgi:hypothetical protein